MQTFQDWKSDFNKNRTSERLGQAFVNDFIKGVWTELFHTMDENKSQALIMDWLVQMQYWPNVPEKVDHNYQSIRIPFIYGEKS